MIRQQRQFFSGVNELIQELKKEAFSANHK